MKYSILSKHQELSEHYKYNCLKLPNLSFIVIHEAAEKLQQRLKWDDTCFQGQVHCSNHSKSLMNKK